VQKGDALMKSTLEQKKEQLKEQLIQGIDRYYDGLAEGLEGKSLKIDDIERMLGEVKVQMDEIVTEATGEVITESAPPTEKNNVPVAERICADNNEK
jgi:hypothetical protein